MASNYPVQPFAPKTPQVLDGAGVTLDCWSVEEIENHLSRRKSAQVNEAILLLDRLDKDGAQAAIKGCRHNLRSLTTRGQGEL
jgi:hypothetical protein